MKAAAGSHRPSRFYGLHAEIRVLGISQGLTTAGTRLFLLTRCQPVTRGRDPIVRSAADPRYRRTFAGPAPTANGPALLLNFDGKLVFGEIAGKQSCAARGGAGDGAPLQMECQTAQLQSAAIPLLHSVWREPQSIETARLGLGFGRRVPISCTGDPSNECLSSDLNYHYVIPRQLATSSRRLLCITVRDDAADPLDRQPQRIVRQMRISMCSLTLAVAQKLADYWQ